MTKRDTDKVIRTNQGYWDGVYARERGRLPEWAPRGGGVKHPFDKLYGEGFWIGWYNEPAPPYAIV